MTANWGHVHEKDNVALDRQAKKYKQALQQRKTPAAVERVVRDFMQGYLKIKEDPTDTVIRDRVRLFLFKTTKDKLAPARVDQIWQEEMRRSQSMWILLHIHTHNLGLLFFPHNATLRNSGKAVDSSAILGTCVFNYVVAHVIYNEFHSR